ncbi:FeoB-associated Cys-rich membrane protein [Magnetovibrio blakemorei]|uniref:FeoB-associated Cys-rich membrane protein n=1 Tax=Magnetovibrio blakemorei TaxID=28181 RepID=A0A1E5Q407_9PROT|nr:FeoB-associated Cys-rich membrane protein [Magnetovibrio blakemorei]OEJ64453.1 hypothetical protein BEN30_16280 [Magnetovibrio blakemorei]
MENQLIEAVILAVIFGLCVLYIVRKGMAKFSKTGAGCGGGGCSGCSSAQENVPPKELRKKGL